MKMQCWVMTNGSHGLVLHDAFWLPAGDYPETQETYERIPAFDFERTGSPVLDLRFITYGERESVIAEFEKKIGKA